MQGLIVRLVVFFLGCSVISGTLTAQDAAEHLDRGKAWADKREYDEAITEYNAALALNPKSADAFCKRGDAWMQKGEIDKALADCNKALKVNPSFGDAYFIRGFVWNNKRVRQGHCRLEAGPGDNARRLEGT